LSLSKRTYDPALEAGERSEPQLVCSSRQAPQGLRECTPVERWRHLSHQRTCQTGTAESLCPVRRVRPRNPPHRRQGERSTTTPMCGSSGAARGASAERSRCCTARTVQNGDEAMRSNGMTFPHSELLVRGSGGVGALST